MLHCDILFCFLSPVWLGSSAASSIIRGAVQWVTPRAIYKSDVSALIRALILWQRAVRCHCLRDNMNQQINGVERVWFTNKQQIDVPSRLVIEQLWWFQYYLLTGNVILQVILVGLFRKRHFNWNHTSINYSFITFTYAKMHRLLLGLIPYLY